MNNRLNTEKILAVCEKHLQENFNKNLQINLFQEIDSTNNYLKNDLNNNLNNLNHLFPVCLAETQTAGRGSRPDRSWHSPFGCNMYFSCAFQFGKSLQELSALSLVISLACVKVIENFYSDHLKNKIKIKWPNDIFIQHKKLGGNLVEIISDRLVIIGVGLNINLLPDENNLEISQPWTSLLLETGLEIDRNIFIAEFILILAQYLKNYEANGFDQKLMTEWQAHDALYHKEVTLALPTGEIKNGVALGVNTQGQLLFKDSQSLEREAPTAFWTGEISIKK